MKQGNFMKRFMAFLIIFTLFASQSAYASEAIATEQVDTPSQWAVWDVQMASMYNLGNTTTYSGYHQVATTNDFLEVQQSFERKFEVEDTSKIQGDTLTRGDVIYELYDVIAPALSLEEITLDEAAILAYYKNNNLIRGRSNGQYDLEATCKKEELLIFAKRVYDHLVYTLGTESKGAYWKVSDEDNTVYLLGSVHVVDETIYPLQKEMLEDFVSSQALIVEANTIAINSEDVAYIQQIVMLEEGTTIDTLLTEETYTSYVEKMTELGMTPEMYNQFKPWYAALLLQSVSTSENNYSAAMGIDMYFQYMANGHIPIVEVEGAKYQMDLFDSFSKELQEGFLLGTLTEEENKEGVDLIAQLMSAWKSGDVETLETLLFSEEEQTDIVKEFNEKLWDIRNKHMTEYVISLLENDTENDYFFIVGAGHMLNDNGIVNGLKEQGYTVERVTE